MTFTFNLSDCGSQCSASGKITDKQVQNEYRCTNTKLTADFLKCLPTTTTELYDFTFFEELLSFYRLLMNKLMYKSKI